MTRVHIRHVVLAAVVLSLVAPFQVPVFGQEERLEVEGRPQLEFFLPDNRVSPGEATRLDIFINNAGVISRGGPIQYQDRVTTARGVRLFVSADDAPVDVRTDPVVAGTVPSGIAGPFPLSLVVEPDAEPGTYQLSVNFRYEHTDEVEYGGDEPPSYSDRTIDETVELTLVVEEQAEFVVREQTSTVQVGEKGKLTLEMENVGSEVASDATVVFNSTDPELRFGAGVPGAESFAGQWEPSERKRFDLDVFIAPNASVRNYVITATVIYRDPDDILRRSDPVVIGVRSQPEQPFAIEPVNATFEIDSDSVLTVVVTNAGVQPVRNVNGRLLTEEPLSSDDPTAFVSELQPGESTRLSFALSVSDDAIPKRTAVGLVFEYDNVAGSPSVSERFTVPITVTRSETPVPIGAIGAVVVALVVVVWWWRRRG